MKLSKGLKVFVEKAKETDSYWVEHAKLAFSVALEKNRRAANLTYAAIAKKINTSGAYITKVFRGDSNMTIETMVKLARATGGHLDIRIVDSASAIHWDVTSPVQKKSLVATQATTSVGSVVLLPNAANHSWYSDRMAA